MAARFDTVAEKEHKRDSVLAKSCPDCERKFSFSRKTVRYQTHDSVSGPVRLLVLRCLGCPFEAAWQVDVNGDLLVPRRGWARPKNPEGSADPWIRDLDPIVTAFRAARQKRKIEELEKKVAVLEKLAPFDGPKGLQGLGKKKTDLSRYFACLTEKQSLVASMKWEYELSTSEIARRLDKHRKTIQYLLDRAQVKMDKFRSRQSVARQTAPLNY